MGRASSHAKTPHLRQLPPGALDDNNQQPTETQQRCLDIFRHALWQNQHSLDATQEVKKHLYNRDFAAAFSNPEYLQAYALRWSASRALGYAAIFDRVRQYFQYDLKRNELRIVSLGGGAGAELVGLAGWLSSTGTDTELPHSTCVRVCLVDIADWSEVTSKLHQGITIPPKISQYASAAVKERNTAMILPDRLTADFILADVLEQHSDDLRDILSSAHVITLMFTLNELYSSSVAKTQDLLKRLTAYTAPDTLLLVVDSPGSYSKVTLNTSSKRYPMHWLLDVGLFGPPTKPTTPPSWNKVHSSESTWFRLPNDLQYPVELENMRYQIHLYQRLAEPESKETG